LLDAAALVGHLVPAGSVFAFLAAHRGEVFRPELFEDLFSAGTGRPSLPGEVAASVLVLQALYDLSDRDAVAAVRCDIRWKVACGLSLDHEGFPKVVVVWGWCPRCPGRRGVADDGLPLWWLGRNSRPVARDSPGR
jgi:hypothetical protein